ncbi:MAG: UDP-N-acetylglucosamine 1-carboxyvinyltransferase [Alphaproteobacteria bacterium GM7ARS4]|nr:UDP-N-acetylglucosamine 1-carboxyvinyltransferase [Alphaproteobacteria bacterium GM7ARS4]
MVRRCYPPSKGRYDHTVSAFYIEEGRHPLKGSVSISGAKNATLPLMAACILSDESLNLLNVPDLADIATMCALLEHLGISIHHDKERRHMTLKAETITSSIAPYGLVRKMRASILVLAPLLARYGTARVALPGGCAIGSRPIDFHLQALQRFGVSIDVFDGDVIAQNRHGKRLRGARIVFPSISVGATENALMAACLAKGESILVNCAREPEVVDLARCLSSMGAQIDGIGRDVMHVQGVETLRGTRHHVIPDRIEAGSYALAVTACGGDIILEGCIGDHLTLLWDLLSQHGVVISQTRAHHTGPMAGQDNVRVRMASHRPCSFDVTTDAYPGFPTDLQAQLMAVACALGGTSTIKEHIFENRFMHVAELRRMNADIRIRGHAATVMGTSPLRGAHVKATDLRASMGLVIAGLAAQGATCIDDSDHIERGYEHIEKKFQSLGARIKKLDDKKNVL